MLEKSTITGTWWRSRIVRYVNRFHKIHCIEWKTTGWNTWSEARLTRKQTTSRPDTLWPEIWKDMQRKAKVGYRITEAWQRSKIDWYLLHRSRWWRIQGHHARGKLELQCLARFNVRSTGKPVAQLKNTRQKYACIAEADESMRKRMEGSHHKYHEDHFAGKGVNSLSHYNIVHKFNSMPQAMKIPDAKAAGEKILAWQLTKVKN